uniref:Globin-sensor domain-containing protein n=1 Tax=Thermofilum pendens TaxID=2269 RepID=A0A7J3X7Z5_THEPE
MPSEAAVGPRTGCCRQLSKFSILSEDDARMLREASSVVLTVKDAIVRRVVNALFSDAEAAKHLESGGLGPEHIKRMIEGWIEATFRGELGADYCVEVAKVGLVFAKARVPLLIVLTRLPLVTQELLKHFPSGSQHLVPVLKVLLTSMRIIAVSYESVRQRMIEKMRETLGVKETLYSRLEAIAVGELFRELEARPA